MYRHKIDITGNDGLTKTYYGEDIFEDKETARSMAQQVREIMADLLLTGSIKGYSVDVVPYCP